MPAESPDPATTTTPAPPPAEVTGTVSTLNEDTHTLRALQRDIAEANARTSAPALGDKVGPYRLTEKLGRGVSCFVFRGWDDVRQCPVAVKVVNWENVVDRDAALKQLRTEATALARVKHPRVVRFLDFGFDPRWPYLVTEFVDGRPLGELVREGGALPVDWTLYLMSQVADGLGAVWRAGLVHRDIKPDNILIGPSGGAKLIDFGLAKSEVSKPGDGSELAGTAAYVAPEQARDASTADRRSDIYSLGVTLYEALTGRLPFDGRNRVQMIMHHMNTPPEPPCRVNPLVPPLASDLCLWMLAKSPDERPQNHEELRSGLDTVMASVSADRGE